MEINYVLEDNMILVNALKKLEAMIKPVFKPGYCLVANEYGLLLKKMLFDELYLILHSIYWE